MPSRTHPLILPLIDTPGQFGGSPRVIRPEGINWLTLIASVLASAGVVVVLGALRTAGRNMDPLILVALGVGGGVVGGLFWYFQSRRLTIGRGELDAFPELDRARFRGDLATLVDGLGQKSRSARIAACRALLDMGPEAAPAVPALIDMLWGTAPLEQNWPAPLPPAKKLCLACGCRLRFWSRDWTQQLCGNCSSRGAPNPEPDDRLPPRAWAARVLGSMRDAARPAIPVLLAAATLDPSAMVRQEALEALEKIRAFSLPGLNAQE